MVFKLYGIDTLMTIYHFNTGYQVVATAES